jgi:hypothetical protein
MAAIASLDAILVALKSPFVPPSHPHPVAKPPTTTAAASRRTPTVLFLLLVGRNTSAPEASVKSSLMSVKFTYLLT